MPRKPAAMHHARRKRFSRMPLVDLRTLHLQLAELISELESAPPREIDIAVNYSGDRSMVARALDVRGDRTGKAWQEVLQIYCSAERCSACPHGEFAYGFRRRRDGSVTVRFRGLRVFSVDTVARMECQAMPLIDVYSIEIPQPANRLQPAADAIMSRG